MAMSKGAKQKIKEVELHPDAWDRFERAAGVVAKTPPQHRATKKTKKKSKKARSVKSKMA